MAQVKLRIQRDCERRKTINKAALAEIVNDNDAANTKLIMLYTLAVILIIAWLLGMVSSYTLGGFIHILLVVAIIAVLIRLIQGRSA